MLEYYDWDYFKWMKLGQNSKVPKMLTVLPLYMAILMRPNAGSRVSLSIHKLFRYNFIDGKGSGTP